MRFFIVLFVVLFASSCETDDVLIETEAESFYSFKQPKHFPQPTYDLDKHPITEAGFLLGKKLFSEVRISRTKDISCENCHTQSLAFTDPQHTISVGVDNRIGSRNAPQLANLAFLNNFMWDGGIVQLDFVAANAITAFHEMDLTLEQAINRLQSYPEYPPLFEKAFGSDSITSSLLLKALSQFQLRLISANSKYDKYLLGQKDGTFTIAEEQGLAVFNANCSSCHQGPLFTDQTFRNNGLDEEFIDIGRASITELDEDIGKFKVPSLRNLNRTAPYMHDGRFSTIEEVIAHYRFGIKNSATLDPSLRNGIELTDAEVDDLTVFLNSLTDWEFIQEPLF